MKKVRKEEPELRFEEFQEKLLNTIFKKVVLSNQYGPRFNANDYDIDGNVKTIRGTDVSLDGEIKYTQVPIARLDFDFIKNHILKDGDLVMITTADCGITGVFRKQDLDYISSAYAVKITLNEIGDSEYFKFFFQTSHAKSEVRSFIRKATVANLPCSDILRIKLHLPSIPEQKKIASFLEAIATHLTQLRRKHELLQTYKRGVMQKIFSQQIRFKQDDGTPFRDWDYKKLGELATRQTKKNEDSSITRVLTNSATQGVIDQQDYFDKDIANADNLFGYYVINKGDYVYNPRISTTAPVGPVNKNNVAQGVMSPLYTVFRFRSPNNQFYEQYFKTSFWHKYMCSVANYGARHDRMNIVISDFLGLPLPSPCQKEQEKITQLIDSIDCKTLAVDKQIESTEKFKQGLLQKMFV